MVSAKKGNIAEDYVFIQSGYRQIVTESKGNKDEEELREIARAYERQKKLRNKITGRPMIGEWRWCPNPGCNRAFYLMKHRKKQSGGFYCSKPCSTRVIEKWKKDSAKFNKLNDFIKSSRVTLFRCSACWSILDEIPGCPGRCPVCKKAVVFAVIKSAPT